LLDLKLSAQYKKQLWLSHLEVLSVVLVNLYKSQCYFAIMLQVTAFVLVQQTLITSVLRGMSVSQDYSSNLLVPLTTAGLASISLTLISIICWGRQFWYILMLLLFIFLLVTVTLLTAFSLVCSDANSLSLKTYYVSINYGPCSLLCSLSNVFFFLCSFWVLQNNYMFLLTAAYAWFWPLCIACLMSLVICVCKRTGRLRQIVQIWQRWQKVQGTQLIHWIDSSVFTLVAIWIFVLQFYFLSTFIQHNLILSEWTFSQIIAVTVWVPSAVKYLYIEFDKLYIFTWQHSATIQKFRKANDCELISEYQESVQVQVFFVTESHERCCWANSLNDCLRVVNESIQGSRRWKARCFYIRSWISFAALRWLHNVRAGCLSFFFFNLVMRRHCVFHTSALNNFLKHTLFKIEIKL